MRPFAFLPVLLWVCALPFSGQVTPGDARFDEYLPRVESQRVGVVCNHTAVIPSPEGVPVHLVDTLIRLGVHVSAAFGPEHGFRGDLPDGAHAPDGIDPGTGVTVHSLYGTNKKPTVTSERLFVPAPPSQNVRIKIAWSGVRVPAKQSILGVVIFCEF